jgi:hypothetical protein
MAQICRKCSRPNPDEASFCYFDGQPFAATVLRNRSLEVGAQPFASPFVFPAGKQCRCFDELVTYSWQHWGQAREALHKGLLEPFLGRLGRVDLAAVAHQAARAVDKDRGLDELLAKFPSKSLKPAKLLVASTELKLGRLKIGDGRTLSIHLKNEGMRLVHGNISCDNCVWLTVGEGGGVDNKHFAFTDSMTIPLQVRGDRLRAGNNPLEAHIVIETNGGNATIHVQADVPAVPFSSGVLAGALNPRQIAEKAKKSPREAAALFEKGAIAAWYKDNGWDYPIKIPTASGITAIQQFFEALGLTAAPKVKVAPTVLKLKARPGAKIEQNIEVTTDEKRAVWAHAIADQPWLQVNRIADGKSAVLQVEIAKVPDRPGEVLRGKVTILSNGRQRFVVPVLLGVISPVKSKKVTPMPARNTVSDSSAETVTLPPQKKDEPVEIVDAVEVLPSEPEPEKIEIVDEVEIIDVPDSELNSVPEPAQPEEQEPLPEPGLQDNGGNPFAFDEGDAAKVLRRKRDDSVFGKIFGRGKRR